MTAIQRTRIDVAQATPSQNPIFRGPVSIQEIVNDAAADLLRVTAVTFDDGAHNRPHRHTTDQVLVATSGSGFVATDDEHHSLEPGDVAFIPVGTRHWHGAAPGETFTHLSILTPGHTEIEDEQIVLAAWRVRRRIVRTWPCGVPDRPWQTAEKSRDVKPKTPSKRCHRGCCDLPPAVPECGHPPQTERQRSHRSSWRRLPWSGGCWRLARGVHVSGNHPHCGSWSGQSPQMVEDDVNRPR